MLPLLLKIILPLAVLYLILCVYALLASDSMIFYPKYSREPEPPGVFRIRAADGVQLSAVYLRNDSARYTVLFSYGNASSLGNSYSFLQWMREQGFSVFGYDYHGYGTSQGKPSEKALYSDIDAAYSHLVDSLHVPPQQIIAFGQSLGGAAAVDLASRMTLAGLIVESSFISAFRVMTRIPLLPFDKFNSISKIGKVRCPVLVIHGDSDHTIPLWHGRALFKAALQPKRLVIIPGGDHNYVPDESAQLYSSAIVDFASGLASR